MNELMIQKTFDKARKDSTRYGICYILSNGQDLQTAATESFKDELKEKGYWVAAIFENGFRVDM